MFRLSTLCAAVVVVSVTASGCLIKDVTETWYVDPAGTVTWVVLEKDVRSDANTPLDRVNEEGVYWSAVQQSLHPAAAGLRELGATHARTLILRGEVPYTVQTEGRFSGLDELGQRLIGSLGAAGSSIVTREGTFWEWTMIVRDPKAIDAVVEPSEGIKALTDQMNELKVVLVSGRFESADGFSISSDRRSATWIDTDPKATHEDEDSTLTLRLKWEGRL